MKFFRWLFGDGSGSSNPSSWQPDTGPKTQPPPDSSEDADSLPADIREMLANPQFFADPMFPKDSYLEPFAVGLFRQILRYSEVEQLADQVRVISAEQHVVKLVADSMIFLAFDFEQSSPGGVSSREEFIARVRTPVRRPPPEMAAFTMEHHIWAKGVIKIQTKFDSEIPGPAELCKLKIVYYYLALMVLPGSTVSTAS